MKKEGHRIGKKKGLIRITVLLLLAVDISDMTVKGVLGRESAAAVYTAIGLSGHMFGHDVSLGRGTPGRVVRALHALQHLNSVHDYGLQVLLSDGTLILYNKIIAGYTEAQKRRL